MLLYHFTSLYHLRGISQYGLTVGDIPTDIDRFKGRIGGLADIFADTGRSWTRRGPE